MGMFGTRGFDSEAEHHNREMGAFGEDGLQLVGLVEFTVCAVRGLVTDRYEVVEFVPPHRFGYRMLSGGWPVRNYRSDLTLTEQDRGTALLWRATFEPRIRNSGWLAAMLIRMVLRRTTRKLVARLSTNPS